MTLFFQYAVLGIAAGAGYVLLTQGLVVTFKGSGVLNLAQAAIGTFGGFWYWEWHESKGWPVWVALLVASLLMAVLGALIHLLIMRPLRNSTSIAPVIATLGIFVTLGSIVYLKWGYEDKNITPFLPTNLITAHGVFIGANSLIQLGVATATTLILWAGYRYTRVGLAIRAGSHDRLAVASLGWSQDTLAAFSWALGAALSTIGIVLVTSQSGLQPGITPLLIFPMLATALIGGFSSLPLTFVGGVLLGVCQSLVTGYVNIIGFQEAVPLLVIVFVLVIRGKGVTVRRSEKLPEIGSGQVRWRLAVPLFALLACLEIFVFHDPTLINAISISLSWAVVMLSVVVLLGYTGQLSFEQVAIGGLAALLAGRLVMTGVPFLIAFAIAVVASVGTGVLFAIPAVRTKGINLAVVTLGLAAVTSAVLFLNPSITGSIDGTPIANSQSLFGYHLDPYYHPDRYGVFVLCCFAICAFVVTNIRRGRAGRRLIAVRTNEEAASALGINVFGAKLYAFMVASTVAAIGGILIAFQNSIIVYDFYAPINSALAVVWAFIGGVGYVIGPLFAAPFAPSGIGSWITGLWWKTGGYWLMLVGGIVVILILLADPNGLASMNVKAIREARDGGPKSKRAYLRLEMLVILAAYAVSRRLVGPPKPRRVAAPLPEPKPVRVEPMTFEAHEVTVRYGGVTAVDRVSLTVRPGEILGLIGPNGSGKSSFINAATGFVRLADGTFTLDAKYISSWAPDRRSRAGIGRSFQSLELFESSTVRENLRVAADERDLRSYFTDLVSARTTPMGDLAIAAVHEFRLEPHLDVLVEDLPYGLRHLVAIARAIAARPSVLMLDEPGAGLSGTEIEELTHAVRRLAREWGMAILVVEHDMNFVMNVCDRIAVLDFGRKIAEGTPTIIRSDPLVIASYLGQELGESHDAAATVA